MGCAEIISCDEVRARKHWTTLRQRLHERFDRWLDRLEAALPDGELTLSQVSEAIWVLRQPLTGGVAETIVHHTHHEARRRQQMPCPTCARLLPARGPVHRCVETMVGAIELERPPSIVRSAVRGRIRSTRCWACAQGGCNLTSNRPP